MKFNKVAIILFLIVLFLGQLPPINLSITIEHDYVGWSLAILFGIWSVLLSLFGKDLFSKLIGTIQLNFLWKKCSSQNISLLNLIQIMMDIDHIDMWSFGYTILVGIYAEKQSAHRANRVFDISSMCLIISKNDRKFKFFERLENAGYVLIFKDEEIDRKNSPHMGTDLYCIVYLKKMARVLGLDHDCSILKVKNSLCFIYDKAALPKVDVNVGAGSSTTSPF